MSPFDVEQIARTELHLLTVIHRDLATTRDYQPHVLHLTAPCASKQRYMSRPPPPGSICRTAHGEPAKRYKLEPPLLEISDLVRGFESFDDDRFHQRPP